MIDDSHDESPLDPALERQISLLPRTERMSAAFTDRVVGDLARRGLVQRPAAPVTARWLVAAGLIFAAGIGVGGVIVRARSGASEHASPAVPNGAAKPGVDVNVPPIGHSEVWF